MLLHPRGASRTRKKDTAMTPSFNIAQVITMIVLAGAASALSLGGALLAIVS